MAQDKKEATLIAKEILDQYKLTRGVVVSCDNIAIAIELAKQSDLRIYSNAKDQDAVETARKLITSEGLSAVKVRVEKGPLETLGYPNFVANIIISTSQLDPQKLKEISRILRPDGFLFIIPNKDDKPSIS